MADCFTFLGNLTPGYLRQYRALPKIASDRRHCDIHPRPWLLFFCYRALVRTFGPNAYKRAISKHTRPLINLIFYYV